MADQATCPTLQFHSKIMGFIWVKDLRDSAFTCV